MKNKLIKYSVIIASTTILLFALCYLIGQLDKKYFELHKAELTTEETVIYDDNSYGTNYTYSSTPYSDIGMISLISYLIIPLILVYTFAVRFMLQEISKRRLLQSLTMPATYSIINIIFFFLTMDKSLGWEYSLGMQLMFVEIGFVCFSILGINSVILLKNKNSNRNSSII